ncbi:sulfotransferase [Ruegeria sp. 6PALISEP08]|uniref:sulfotransferase n=1 Tax=Ruegeria sp. 6PALISEP08 TaxID=1225660 RepID=UPI000AAC6A00
MPLSVIGAGFGRTGTESLKKAIEILGLGPCYHMFEVLPYPERVAVWRSAAGGDTPDWDQVFAEYI